MISIKNFRLSRLLIQRIQTPQPERSLHRYATINNQFLTLDNMKLVKLYSNKISELKDIAGFISFRFISKPVLELFGFSFCHLTITVLHQ